MFSPILVLTLLRRKPHAPRSVVPPREPLSCRTRSISSALIPGRILSRSTPDPRPPHPVVPRSPPIPPPVSPAAAPDSRPRTAPDSPATPLRPCASSLPSSLRYDLILHRPVRQVDLRHPQLLQLRPDRRAPLRLLRRRSRPLILRHQLIHPLLQALPPPPLLHQFRLVRRLAPCLIRPSRIRHHRLHDSIARPFTSSARATWPPVLRPLAASISSAIRSFTSCRASPNISAPVS